MPFGRLSPRIARPGVAQTHQPPVLIGSAKNVVLDLRPSDSIYYDNLVDLKGSTITYNGTWALQPVAAYSLRTGLVGVGGGNANTLNATIFRIPNKAALQLNNKLFAIEIEFVVNSLSAITCLVCWMGLRYAVWSPVEITINTSGNILLYASSANSSSDIANARVIGQAVANTNTILRLTRTATQWKTYVNGTLTDTLTSSLSPYGTSTYDVVVGGNPTGAAGNPTLVAYENSFDGAVMGMRATIGASLDAGSGYMALPSPQWQ